MLSRDKDVDNVMGEDIMGRPERPIDPAVGPLYAFAYDLRQLRTKAGSPSYRTLATRAHYSPATLARAASGMALPSLSAGWPCPARWPNRARLQHRAHLPCRELPRQFRRELARPKFHIDWALRQISDAAIPSRSWAQASSRPCSGYAAHCLGAAWAVGARTRAAIEASAVLSQASVRLVYMRSHLHR